MSPIIIDESSDSSTPIEISMHSNFAMLSLVCFLCPALLVCFGVHIHFHLAHVASLHCNQTCHEIPGIVCLRNGSQKACSDIPHGYTDLCIHFWLASFLHALWLVIFLQNLSRNATNKYHLCFAFQKIEKAMSDSSVYRIYAVASSKRETKGCYSQRDGNNLTYSLRLKVCKYICDRSN